MLNKHHFESTQPSQTAQAKQVATSPNRTHSQLISVELKGHQQQDSIEIEDMMQPKPFSLEKVSVAARYDYAAVKE